MKKGILACLVAIVVLIGKPISLHLPAFTSVRKAIIAGKISPADGADIIWIIGAKDTLKTTIALGNFSQSVSPGVYKLIVAAKDPYKDAMLDNLDVKEDQVLDVGEIILQK